ncbi:NUDIX hydrolase [Aggregicoccus sp. 17bor-14]|uniref:NUDIX hydrolase n=1 Tax=Myxococcaceae TaxID=31 RepID=UPI00129CC56E|nr:MULTISPECIES: NUDIX hydrolase [Myxococcaceae]MBF5043202.1 NUDIX hydrolase [Simulacricoccus sp. 17bor-14]MRI88959.1 NUDIX hydrolase [Aggregicoccus sp. 17bor-14]
MHPLYAPALALALAAVPQAPSQAPAPPAPSARAPVPAADPPLPAGYWPAARVDELLAKTETLRLAPDLSRLTPAEQGALRDLLEVGRILQRLYEDSRHPQALAAQDRLQKLDARLGSPPRTQRLLQLYRLFQGPIATTLDNSREPFLPVAPQTPARNVYPADATREELDAFLAEHPERSSELMHERTVVRRATAANVARDQATLQRHPALALLHPQLPPRLKALAANPDARAFYAVPYPVAYADAMVRAYGLLVHAADTVQPSDSEFAGYLRNRARDLLSNDYESGDAAWVTGRFKRLNAQLGAYETYDDALYGVKTFHGVSLLLTDEEATTNLRRALGGLQAVEDALPYPAHKRVREDIPVGVYEVIADFGQARGTNTATNLPNEPLYSRRYGRTILLRENIMKNPRLFAQEQRVWRTAVAEAHGNDLTPEGPFQRTLWHEVGHYLGAERDAQGRTLDEGLQDDADALEEMKSDLVSLFALLRMGPPPPKGAPPREGGLDPATLRSVQASGILRTLQNNRPRKDQPYGQMQLVQFNWFRERGLIEVEPRTQRLVLHYERYPEAVQSLLKEVLALQLGGDKEAAARFFERWTQWTPEVHEPLAARIREAQGARYTLVRYGALGEQDEE